MAGATLVNAAGSNGPQLSCGPAIVPPKVTLQHGVTDTVTEQSSVQPFASVTSTEYVPAASPEIDEPVPPLLHTYVYGAVPTVADTLADARLLFAHDPSILEHVASGTGLTVTQITLLSPT